MTILADDVLILAGPGDRSGRPAAIVRPHWFDAALHRAITETGPVDGAGLLERAAATAVIRSLAAAPAGDPPIEVVARLFSETGLGALDVSGLGREGGVAVLRFSTFAAARLEMFGSASAPSCDVARGILMGALSSLFERPFVARETSCTAMGAGECRFVVEPGSGSLELPLPGFDWNAEHLPDRPVVDPILAQAMEAVWVDGTGPAGSTYGRLWVELYARATREFAAAVPRVMGAKFGNLPAVVLSEAAHLGSFYSLGGLIRSASWRLEVAPTIPAREAWIEAILNMLGRFGWGRWEVKLLVPDRRFTVQVQDGYEALAHLALGGGAMTPGCYTARGVAAGMMNVLFTGDALGAKSLDRSLYNTLFRSPLSYRAIETRCQAMGDPYCEFVANPLSVGPRG